MEKKSIIVPEEIHLFKIEVIEEQIDVEGFLSQENKKFGIAHKIMHNLEDERVKIELAFSFKDDSDSELVFFLIEFHYQIENMSNLYEKTEDGKPIFSAILISTLLGISLSTSRGIIFERLGREGISNVLIPVVSPQKILVKNGMKS